MTWHVQKMLLLGFFFLEQKKISVSKTSDFEKYLIINSMLREKIKGSLSDKNLYSSSQIFHPTLISTHKNVQILLSSTPFLHVFRRGNNKNCLI